MTESIPKLADIKVVLKRKGLNYKLKNHTIGDNGTETYLFLDVLKEIQVCGKAIRSFNEGEIYHWPLLNHENIAPLLDVLYIQDDFNIFLTTYHEFTLKEIIHDEDFVYNPRCFDRKRAYARGIFSGLSYLHRKSLCLMNLSDANIAISKIYDKPVISNFSCLVYANKTTRNKIKLPEVYKPPESENGEFDPIAAEIWASGTLMLDMFLAHMVPWAVIDYKPKRVMEIVDKLSLELLQAANTGSVVSAVDLVKFKAFLKCFFKKNPGMRITARYASIASFLCPKFSDSTVQIDLTNSDMYPNSKLNSQTVKRGHLSSNSRTHVSCFGTSQHEANMQYSSSKENHQQSMAIKQFNSKHFYNDLTSFSQPPDTSKCSIYNSPVSIHCSPKLNEKRSPIADIVSVASEIQSPRQHSEKLFEEIKNELSTSQDTNSALEKKNSSKEIPSPFIYESKDLLIVSEPTVHVEKASKSCQTNNADTNLTAESIYTCYQSKSLSFIKSKSDNIDDPSSLRIVCSRTCSYSSIKSMPTEKSSAFSVQNSDLCLNHLFGNDSLTENFGASKNIESTANTKRVISSGGMQKIVKAKESIPYEQSNPFHHNDSYKALVAKSHVLPRRRQLSKLPSRPDLQEIVAKIIFIKKCEISLQNHCRVFISEEFAYKQRKLLNAYELLLHREHSQLRENLKRKCELNLDNRVKLSRYLNSKPQCLVRQNKNISLYQNRKNIPFKICQNRFQETEKPIERTKDVANIESCKDTAVTNVRPIRQFSYCRAIKNSEQNYGKLRHLDVTNKIEEQYESDFGKGGESKEKLTGTIPKTKYKAGVKHVETELKNKERKECKIENPIVQETIGNEKIEDELTENKKSKKGKNGKGEKKKKNQDKKKKKTQDKKKKKNQDKNKNKKDDKKKDNNDKRDHTKVLDNKKAEEIRRSFFFNLCPGGKIEEPTPVWDNLCGACKLHYGVVSK